MWQDILLTGLNIMFSFALVPQIIHNFKTKKKNIAISTGLVSSLGMYAVSFIYFTLNLYATTIVGIVSGTLWLTLLIQSIVYRNN